MKRHKSTYDIFFGIERRLKERGNMEDKFNKKAKQGWRFAADAPVHTNWCRQCGLQAHVGRVSFAIDIGTGLSSTKKEGAFASIIGNEVDQEDKKWLSIAQVILWKGTDFWSRIIAAVDEMGEVILSYVCPHCHCFPIEDCI